jgi:hypothetical protein
VAGYAKAHNIPVVNCSAGERKHDLADDYLGKTTLPMAYFLSWSVGRSARRCAVAQLPEQRQGNARTDQQVMPDNGMPRLGLGVLVMKVSPLLRSIPMDRPQHPYAGWRAYPSAGSHGANRTSRSCGSFTSLPSTTLMTSPTSMPALAAGLPDCGSGTSAPLAFYKFRLSAILAVTSWMRTPIQPRISAAAAAKIHGEEFAVM